MSLWAVGWHFVLSTEYHVRGHVGVAPILLASSNLRGAAMRSSSRLLALAILFLSAGGLAGLHFAAGQNEPTATIKGWKRGVGWGWIWGQDDEVGSLNAMTDPSRTAALRLAPQGKVYDLGITYSRR